MSTRTPPSRKSLVRLLRFIGAGAGMIPEPGGVVLQSVDGRRQFSATGLIEWAMAAGLVTDSPSTPPLSAADAPAGSSETAKYLILLPAARSFLRRAAADTEEEFLAQHAEIVSTTAEVDGARQKVRFDQAESPLAALSRLKDRNGAPFLPEAALAAGEKLASDFNRGQLQPRVTASWEPRLATSAKGGRGGMADVADSAMAARLAVNRAIAAMGPELSGVALDICCFTKGLTTVERERQWPARSAKLMLRTALLTLSRHYTPPRSQKNSTTQHWGAEGYRPDLL